MAREVDQHVVEMVFDNDKFEQNARTTMSTLDKLKEKLGFGDASDGFDKLDDAAGRVDLTHLEDSVDRVSSRFSSLGVIGMTALQNIANKAVQLGEQIINALVFEAPKAGFQEYELQQNTIQTILSATGEELKTVKDELDQLNEYADKTIYVFSDMTQNISKFTNQGIKLETSVNAIKGISNLAADAGASAQQASHAMYNFAQALGAGSVKLIDWKSIQNATMDTVDFKNVLIQMGGALGTVQKELDETGKGFRYFMVHEKTTGSGKKKKTTYEKEYITAANFMETLKKGWLTNDVLLQSLAVYAGEVSEELLHSMGFTETQIKKMLELGKRANEAATRIKTATQMVDTWREAAGTGWAKSFEYIFGDFNEATELFTSIGHKIGDELDRMSEARNNFLKGWHENGGYKNFVDILNGLVDAGLRLKDVAGRGFLLGLLGGDSSTDVFKGALDFTEKIKMAVDSISESLKPNGQADSMYAFLMGLSNGAGGVLSIVLNFFTSLGSAIGKLTVMLDPFMTSVRWIVHMAGAWIADIARFIKQNKVFERTFDNILLLLKPAVDLINRIGIYAAKAFSGFREWAKENQVFEKAWYVLTAVLGLAAIAVNKIALVVPKAYKKVKEFLKGVWSGVSQWAKPAFDWINEKFSKLADIGGQILKGDFSGVEKFFTDLVNSFNQGVEDAKKWFEENIASNPIYQFISDFFGGIIKEIAKFFTTDSEGKELVFSDDATWWDKVEAYFSNGVDKAGQWFKDNIANNPVVQSISDFFTPIASEIAKFFTPKWTAKFENGAIIVEKETWWTRVQDFFTSGLEQASAFFSNFKADPVVSSIMSFFGKIGSALLSAITNAFSPYEKAVGMAGDRDMEVYEIFPWYYRFIDMFNTGIKEVSGWFDSLKDNEILTAIGGFFGPIIKAIEDFFATTKDENGNDVTWWNRVIDNFKSGKESIEKWFDDFKENPVVAKISGFFGQIIKAIADFFATTKDENGNDVTWCNRVIDNFKSGKEAIEKWFDGFKENPVVAKISGFFGPIIKAIEDFFATTKDENGNDVTWWNRVIDNFKSGKEAIEKWFDDIKENPIVTKISEFFDGIRKAINNIFGGDKKDGKLSVAFGMSASDVFGPRGTKEMHDALYPEETWWEQLIIKFREGITMVRHFFMLLPESPIIQAIGDFFTKIIDKTKEFFGDSTDENGNTVHWWTRMMMYFIRGRNTVIQWFNVNVANNPLYKSISEFFSGIIDKIGEFFTTEVDSEGNETTWWGRVKKIFTDGIEFLTGWFGSIKDKEPIKSIREFFSGIGKAIGSTIKNGFGEYTKVTHLGDNEEDIVETFPWYQRFIDVFESGFEQIKAWFASLAENNPIIAAIRNFFVNTWAKITGIFTGEDGGFDFKTGATTILTGMQEKLAGFVESLKGKHGELSGKTSDIMKAVTDYVSGLFKTDKSTEKKIENDKQGPITLIGLVGNVFQLMFEAVALMWQGLSDIIGKMKFDALWDFLDHLVKYWNAFTLGNAVGAVKNITTILSFKMRVELIEDLAKLFGAMALLAGVIAGFATLPENQVAVGFGFLAALIVIIVGLMAYTHRLDKAGADSKKAAKNIDGITDFTNSLAQTFGGTAFLAAITALASAASGALSDIVKLGMEGANYKDIWSAIGYLAATLAVLFIFANGGSILTKFFSDKIGSSLGFNLDLNTLTQGGDNAFIEKAMKLSSTGLDNLTNVAALALSLKAFTGAIKEIHDLMKEQGWTSVEGASAEIKFITILMAEVIAAMAIDNWADTLIDRKIKDKNTDREAVKKSLADALESAANLLAIAQAVKMLVEALEPIIRMQSIYSGEEVQSAINKLGKILGAVLVVKELDTFADRWSSSWKDVKPLDDTSTKGIVAAIINNPIIAIAGSVWILVQALVSLINATKQIPEGMSFELYLGKIEELLGYVLGADSIMTLFSGAASKLGGGKGGWIAVASAGVLFGGVAFVLTQIKDLMNIIPDQTKLDQFDMAVLKLGEVVAGMLVALAGTEGVTSLASQLDMASIGKLGLIMVGLGLLLSGTIWATGHAAEGFGAAFGQISEGVTKIKEAITDMSDEDVKKLEAFAKAVGVLGEAQAAVSGAKYGGDFLSRLLSHWFGLDATNGENLETLGQYTEGFAEHIPAIIEKIKGINNDIQEFEAFIGFIQNMAILMYISHELAGGWDLVTIGENLEKASTKLGNSVSNLAKHKEDYEAAMSGLWFIQEFSEFARNFHNDKDLSSGITQVEDAAFEISASKIPLYMASLAVEIARGITDNDKTIVSQMSTLITTLVSTVRGKYNDFYTAGKYVSQGLANGMLSLGNYGDMSVGSIYYAGYSLAKTAISGINDGAKVASPSREAYATGEFIVAGLANAMRDESYIAYDEGLDLATASIEGMRSALSDDLASSIEDDFLTIRPVMDMSDIQNGMDTIDAYTHGYRDFNIGGWRTQNNQLQNGSFGSYSTLQASRINNADINAYIPYDDYRVVAGLNGLNAKLDSIDNLVDKINNLQLVLDSGLLVGGIANKMNRRLGVIATREERRS